MRPKPSCEYRMITVPRPMRAKLRMTWNATWGSFEQACTQMSPLLRLGSSASVGSSGRGANAAGRLSARPKRSSKNEGPKPTVIVSWAGSSPKASPVSTGGDIGLPSTAPTARPWVMRLAAAAQAPSMARTSSRSKEVMSKAAKANRSCAGVAMPAWCAP